MTDPNQNIEQQKKIRIPNDVAIRLWPVTIIVAFWLGWMIGINK